MEKIKPYMFWVVCGVILLIELVLAVSLDPVNEKGHNVVKATSTLNSKVENFDVYVKKASRKPPQQFEIDNVSYFKKMEKEYLVSKSWIPGLEKVQNQLAEHKANVEQDLAKRSAILYKGVCDVANATRYHWYQDYNAKTVALLDDLYKAEQLVLSSSNPLLVAKDKEDVSKALKTSKVVRDIAGFYTTSGEYPSVEEQAFISLKFRISEAIVKAVMSAEGSLIENNMITYNDVNFVTPPEGVVKPKLLKVTWDNRSSNWDSINKREIKGGSAIPLKVKMRGSVSALLSATAQIENSQEPIFVVYGSDWTQPNISQGEVTREMDQAMDLELRIAVLDYHGGQQ